MSWRGAGEYSAIAAGQAGGGGMVPPVWGSFRPVLAGVAGGGGRVPSSAAPLQGLGGCGGPGPGALIGLP